MRSRGSLRECMSLLPRARVRATRVRRSYADWMAQYGQIVTPGVPRTAVGAGLGCWLDSSDNNTWAVTPASAAQRVTTALADGVPELAMFRMYTETSPPWPLPFWWPEVERFVRGG